MFMICNKWRLRFVMNDVYNFQREKDDALNELDAMRDRLDITQASHNRLAEEKEVTAKELDKVLEKYER